MFRSDYRAPWPRGPAAPAWRLVLLAAVLILGVAQPVAAASAESPINVRAPAQPVYVQATAVDGAALLSWAAPYDNGSRITGYTVTAYSTDTNGEVVAARTVSGDTTSLRWIGVDGPFLKPGVSYAFTAQALDASGWGPMSDASNAVVPETGTPDAPSNVQAAAGNNSATVSWSGPISAGRRTWPRPERCWATRPASP